MNLSREKYLLVGHLGKDVVKMLRDANGILAGGAITSLFSGRKVSDWDLYFRTISDYQKAESFFNINGKRTFVTDRSATYSLPKKKTPYQLIAYIEKLGGEPREIFKKYDFTVCMCAFDFKVDEFVFDPRFWKHLAQRRLVFNAGTLYPIVSMLRVQKYCRRGFVISGVETMKMALTVQKLRIDNFKDLREQLMGIDTAFLKDLTDRFAEGGASEEPYEFEKFMEQVDEFIQQQHELGTLDEEVEALA